MSGRLFIFFTLALILTFSAAAEDIRSPDWKALIRPEHHTKIASTEELLEEYRRIDIGKRTTGGDLKADLDPKQWTELLRVTNRIDPRKIIGRWQCRKILATKPAPFSYPFFTCEITYRNGQLFFNKTGGSQPEHGYLYVDDGSRIVYLGRKMTKDLDVRYGRPEIQDTSEADVAGILLKKSGANRLLLVAAPDKYGKRVIELRR